MYTYFKVILEIWRRPCVTDHQLIAQQNLIVEKIWKLHDGGYHSDCLRFKNNAVTLHEWQYNIFFCFECKEKVENDSKYGITDVFKDTTTVDVNDLYKMSKQFQLILEDHMYFVSIML